MLKSVLLIVWLGNLVDAQLGIGSPCMTQKLEPGTCKAIRECDSVLRALQQDRTSKVMICDYTTRTVCCPSPIVATTKSPALLSNRISAQKCREYGENNYESTVINALAPGNGGVVKKRSKCAHTVLPLIVGGELTKEKEFPHMALIGYWSGVSEEYSCAGTLISPLYILSAAHCSSSGRLGKAKFAKVGDVRRQSNNPNTYKYNIIEIINHPQYTKKLNDHDIALFKLDKTVTFNDYVIPACLPTADDSTDHVIATGWGTTGFGESAANDLLKVVLDVFQQPDCQMNYQLESRLPSGIDYDRVLCAGSHNESKDTCSGDSGGPVQIYNNDVYCMYTIVGVTSFGSSFCGTIGVPGVYTRVYYYLSWIEGIVWN